MLLPFEAMILSLNQCCDNTQKCQSFRLEAKLLRKRCCSEAVELFGSDVVMLGSEVVMLWSSWDAWKQSCDSLKRLRCSEAKLWCSVAETLVMKCSETQRVHWIRTGLNWHRWRIVNVPHCKVKDLPGDRVRALPVLTSGWPGTDPFIAINCGIDVESWLLIFHSLFYVKGKRKKWWIWSFYWSRPY